MDLFNYIFDFVSGVDDGFREIEKEIERLFVRQILAPAKKYEINQIEQESSQAGIYAIGDCCYYDGKIDLIATGLGEAPTAVNNAINYIDPEQKVQPKHSTSL